MGLDPTYTTATRNTTFARAGAIGLGAELVKMGIDWAISQPPYNGNMIYEIEYDANKPKTNKTETDKSGVKHAH